MLLNVVSVTSPNASRLERNLQFVISDHYSYELGRKVKPAHIQRVQQGLWVSRPPIGYILEAVGDTKNARRVPKRLAPHPTNADKVTRLFQLYDTGSYSLNMIIKEADAMKLTTISGAPVARSHIAILLRNPVYIGKTVYGRSSNSKFEKKGPRPQSEWVVADGLHPPLIDIETFNRCGQILSLHKRTYGMLTGGKPLLTGLLFYGRCGSKMLGRSRWRTRGKDHKGPGRAYWVTYRCYQFEQYRKCDNGSYYGGAGLEKFAKEQLMKLPITDMDRRAAKVEAMRLLSSQRGDIKGQLKTLLDQKEGHLADLKALSWRLVRDEIPAALYAEMRQEKESQLATLEKQIAAIQTTNSLEANVDDVLAFLEHVDWNDFDDQAWKEALAVLVERIVVESKGHYRIEWQPGAELLASK
jgi:hypothetical protein